MLSFPHVYPLLVFSFIFTTNAAFGKQSMHHNVNFTPINTMFMCHVFMCVTKRKRAKKRMERERETKSRRLKKSKKKKQNIL